MQNDMRDRLVELLRADMHTECDKSCFDCPYCNDEDACFNHLATKCADHLIANDVVPVVRCKDCTEWDEDECECSHWYGFKENDYCIYGERKDDNANV